MFRQELTPKLSLLRQLCLSACLIFSAAAFADETQPESQHSEAKGKLPLDELRILADVFMHIRHNYVEETSDRELLEHAVRGMLAGLDPHSNYLNAKSFDNLQTQTKGEFGGLGIEVGMQDGFIKVIAPMDGTPAEKAGILAGDLIIAIDKQPIKGLSLQQAVNKMRGEKGSIVRLTLMRERIQNAFDIDVVRDIISITSVRHRLLEPDYGYIRIANFQTKTVREFREALSKLHQQSEELKGLVIDLRNNPGGILGASVGVVDTFINDGKIVYTEGRNDRAYTEHLAQALPAADKTPLIVLINGGSASASEIVAGALQDHKRAVIMGTKSFGKGSVQTLIPLEKERAIKLTTARYFTPNGRSIQAQGITPDIEVVPAKVETYAMQSRVSEADLHGHLESDGKEQQRDLEEEDTLPLAVRDNQLFEALNLLKGLHVAKQKGL